MPSPFRPVISERRLAALICAALLALVWIVFGQTLRAEFINYDDPQTVYEEPEVMRGLSLRGVAWAFSHPVIGLWAPLTALSHMADCQWYGQWAGGHHLTNVLLHAAAAVSLFLALWQLTGALWRSAFVAAVFAVHPLHVESVAWVTERKDVLSGLFFALALGAYARAVRTRDTPRSLVLVVTVFALGLLCKVMLVTLPFVLLLLDYWPLRRWQGSADDSRKLSWPTLKPLIEEKYPLFLLAAFACGVAVLTNSASIMPAEKYPLTMRAGNALVSYVLYLKQTVWPTGMAIYYPHPGTALQPLEVLLAALLLAALSAGVFLLRVKRPYLLVGWCWYLGMLVPVIGLIQAGTLARADRYQYLPQIGLALIVAWGVSDLVASRRHGRLAAGAAAAGVIAILMVVAHRQAAYWQDSETVWVHTLACTSRNSVAHNNLGVALAKKGRVEEAVAHYQSALEIDPDYAEAHTNAGTDLLPLGRAAEALAHYEQALRLTGNSVSACNNLAWLLATWPEGKLRDGAQTVELGRRAVQATADADPNTLDTLAAAYAEMEHFTEAAEAAQRARALAQAAGDSVLAADIESRLHLYEKGLPYRHTFTK